MAMTISERVSKRRAALRKAGLRPIQIWVPDTSAPGFAEECRRQSLMLRDDPHEQEIMDFLDAAADREGWE
ncbi:Antitoxin MazE [Caballeronia calidae]|uniref:Antitoxin MazE n=1 Tax=Caballeronia calidae TaxID=1777139 RepID=A0A158E9B2_9BURK|nr:antitoxin MazE family protein [Caballeronia calidae]SAL03491.1 Antitoxin MazE [Caballeronia calidae]